MDEQKIAEMLCGMACTHKTMESRERCIKSGGCETLKPIVNALLALIAEDRAGLVFLLQQARML